MIIQHVIGPEIHCCDSCSICSMLTLLKDAKYSLGRHVESDIF